MDTIVKQQRYIAHSHGEEKVFCVQELVAGPEKWPEPFRIQLAACSGPLSKTIYGMSALDAIAKASEPQFSTVRLWKGEQRRKFNTILAALGAEEIALHFDETANISMRNGLLRIFMGQVKSTPSYEVWVFSSDLERARAATQRFTTGIRPEVRSSKSQLLSGKPSLPNISKAEV